MATAIAAKKTKEELLQEQEAKEAKLLQEKEAKMMEAIKSLIVKLRRPLTIYRDLGEYLLYFEESLGHGEWEDWLKDNFKLSIKTANNWIRVFYNWENVIAPVFTKYPDLSLRKALRLITKSEAAASGDEIPDESPAPKVESKSQTKPSESLGQATLTEDYQEPKKTTVSDLKPGDTYTFLFRADIVEQIKLLGQSWSSEDLWHIIENALTMAYIKEKESQSE